MQMKEQKDSYIRCSILKNLIDTAKMKTSALF